MPTGRIALSSAAVNGKIYVMGGVSNGLNWGDLLKASRATTKTLMITARNSFSGSVAYNKIHVFGGHTHAVTTSISSVEEYDPHSDSSSSLIAIEKWDRHLQTSFSINPNYPNPFNPTTNIEFSIPKSEFVTLRIYNILGEEVATLVSERLAAGKHKYDWPTRSSGGDVSRLASGVYLYPLQTDQGFSQTRKLILLK